MPRPDAYITSVEVWGVKEMQKKCVYVVQTTWSDGMNFEIYRRYSEFFSFQSALLKLYPNLVGQVPSLPSTHMENILTLLGRTNSEQVFKCRLQTIDNYCKIVLLRLKDSCVSRSKFVLNFFHPTIGDKQLIGRRIHGPASPHPLRRPSGTWEEYLVLADYKPEEEAEGYQHQLAVEPMETVSVMSKDPTGWYLCMKRSDSIGWVPGEYLHKKDEVDKVELGYVADEADEIEESTVTHTDQQVKKYRATADYETDDAVQISFPEGAIIDVLDEDEDGWWFASYRGRKGWVPGSFLEREGSSVALPSEQTDKVLLPKDTAEANDPISTKTSLETQEDGQTFLKGTVIQVLNKSSSGWWSAMYVVRSPVCCDTGSVTHRATSNDKEKLQRNQRSVFDCFTLDQCRSASSMYSSFLMRRARNHKKCCHQV